MLSFSTHAAAMLGTGETFLANYQAKWSLILVSFYKLSLYRTPHLYGVSLGLGLTPQNRLDCRVNLSVQAH